MINVTERINEFMALKGWTPYELSNQTGISTNAIYDWNKKGAVPNAPEHYKDLRGYGNIARTVFLWRQLQVHR